MNFINKKLEIPFGDKRKLFIYIQMYNGKQCQINIYYYTDEPYDSSPLGADTMSFGIGLTFKI
jgi:hypothetical protein